MINKLAFISGNRLKGKKSKQKEKLIKTKPTLTKERH